MNHFFGLSELPLIPNNNTLYPLAYYQVLCVITYYSTLTQPKLSMLMSHVCGRIVKNTVHFFFQLSIQMIKINTLYLYL
jgi:hypothetical protein